MNPLPLSLSNCWDTRILVMAREHPDAPRQFGIRLSDQSMELVSEIQEWRRRTGQSATLAAIVEDAIDAYYDQLVEDGVLVDER